MTATGRRLTWRQAPHHDVDEQVSADPTHSRLHERVHSVALMCAMVFIAGAVPVQRAIWVAGVWSGVVVAAATTVGVLLVRRFGQTAWGWFGPAALAALVAAVVAGPQLSFWVCVSLMLAVWGGGVPPPGFAVAVPPPACLAPLTIAAMFAMLRSREEFGWHLPVAFGALGVLTILVLTRWPDLLRRIGHRLGNWIGAVLFSALGLVVIAAPAVARRLTPRRWQPSFSRDGWVVTERVGHTVERPWSPTATMLRPRGPARSSGLALVVVAIIVPVLVLRIDSDPATPPTGAGSTLPTRTSTPNLSTPEPPPSIPTSATAETGATTPVAANAPSASPAYAGDSWWPRYSNDMSYAFTWLDIFREVGTTKLKDGSTTYMTIKDGGRVAWRPPPCACRRVTVSIYGSATGMGVGQRDEFTVASMLAKRAWKDGIAVDVVNRAMPGAQYWAQVNRFAWDLTQNNPPDIVIFYVGVADLNAAMWLDERGEGDKDWPVDTMTAGFMENEQIVNAVRQSTRGNNQPPPPPPGVSLPPPAAVTTMDPEAAGRLASARLNRTLPMGAELADHYRVQPFWIWEPMRFSRPFVKGDAVAPGDLERRRALAEARSGLDRRIVDLSDAFSSVPRPLYAVDVHHNEEAAAIVADLMYDKVSDALKRVAAG